MIFRQLFDSQSSTYSYLIASDIGREAVLIDPVSERLEQYLSLIHQLDLKLVRAIDTHTHADHITALGALRDQTGCTTIMGELSKADCVSERVKEGDRISVDGIELNALFTPGHTDDSFSFYLPPNGYEGRVFTGDVLLIRGSGRTDFQGGDPHSSFDSITNKLFRLPEQTLVYPAHDYRGMTCSSIYEEQRFNPRLAGKTEAEYVAIMEALNLPDPKMMDVAIPANRACGKV